jgi:fluoride exporter
VIRSYFFIALGGILGAGVRWAVDDCLVHTSFHWAIFIVNVAGCLVLGFLLAKESRATRYRLWLRDFGAIGFCGGLTTMSTFSLDVVKLLDNHRYSTAVLYLSANLIGGFIAVICGALLCRRLHALTRPVEGEY